MKKYTKHMKKYTKQQILEAIKYWENQLKNQFLFENIIPTDKHILLLNFNDNSNSEKYVPTINFLREAYSLLNERLFDNKLPQQLIFELTNNVRNSAVGSATYIFNRTNGSINPKSIILNCTRTLSLHDWLEIVVHEMIHIVDYITHPEHFLIRTLDGKYSDNKCYDPHGAWFLTYGAQFNKYGFHVQKFCKSNVGVNIENLRVKNMLNRSQLLLLNDIRGYDNKVGGIIRVSLNCRNKIIEFLKQRKCCKSISILTSDNPAILKLPEVRMRNSHSCVKYNFYTEKFKQKYGPFTIIDTINVMNTDNDLLSEDKDEMDIDDMNILDDQYARTIYDRIKGVIDVQKKNNNEYIVSIA